jgi:hypothetical protein
LVGRMLVSNGDVNRQCYLVSGCLFDASVGV